jgi:tetraacyldisaccharide 4'-kinase
MRRGLLTWVLWPVSVLFQALVALRRKLYCAGWLKSMHLPVPVVVVGNLFVGGTGKTPLAIWLAGELRRAGFLPGVISRGYGAKNNLPRLVTSRSVPSEVGDEPVLIASRARCPVMVGRDRIASATALLSRHPEVNIIISDDGLQHYALERHIEIVLFDARGYGNGFMMPAGPLREPATRRRDFTVVNADHIPSGMPADAIRMQLLGDTAEHLMDRSQRIKLNLLSIVPQGAELPRIIAAAGIGNPARFFAMLRAAGVTFEELALPDHYDFAGNPFAGMTADLILITEKDAVKCSQNERLKNDPRIWVVPVTTHIEGALADKILEKLRGYPTA